MVCHDLPVPEISLASDGFNIHPQKFVNPVVGLGVPINEPHSGRQRAAKVIKKVMDPVLLVVSANIKLNDIILTNELTLVGRFGGRKCSATSLKKWVTKSWMDTI